ncbi:MAG: DUF4393 domain-containing protein [Holophagales bacterium]|nr:DUF4393 domain-containing protein [Holophagales bacterium]
MTDPVSEIAKATQEVAKTTRVGIEAAQQLGAFLARVLGDPVEAAVGIMTDRLRFTRLERRLRLADRYDALMMQRGLQSTTQPVPPKLALPAIESASLETDDELQDLWANLIASAHDPSLNGIVRSAFIDILRQLEVVDVHVLNLVYRGTVEVNERQAARAGAVHPLAAPRPLTRFATNGLHVQRVLRLSRHDYECAADNLMRVRCIAPYVEDVDIETFGGDETASLVHEYGYVAITALGIDFVKACTAPQMPPVGL